MQYISNSAEETKQIAKKIAKNFKEKGGVIGLSGELGAGKTTFTQGFAESFGITEKVNSPTFTIIKQHQIPNSNRTLYHIDLYRLENPNLKELGIEDLLNEEGAIILIEWPEKIADKLDKRLLKIEFKKISLDERSITLPD